MRSDKSAQQRKQHDVAREEVYIGSMQRIALQGTTSL
jgi:hypothetical protein